MNRTPIILLRLVAEAWGGRTLGHGLELQRTGSGFTCLGDNTWDWETRDSPFFCRRLLQDWRSKGSPKVPRRYRLPGMGAPAALRS